MSFIDYLVLGLFLCGMVFIAWYTRNKAKSSDDFLLAGKKGINGWMSAFAYGTTYFSAVIFIGYAGQFGLKYGLSAVWIGVGNALLGSLFAWLLLAKRTKNMTTRLQSKTMPDFFAKRYESKGLKLLSAIIVFVFLIPYGASVFNGLGALFNIIFGTGDSKVLTVVVILVLALVTALYLCVGGYLATSLSDFVQGIIMLVGVVAMVLCIFLKYPVNGTSGIEKLIAADYGWFVTKSNGKMWLFDNTMTLISIILLTSIGVYGLPQTVHKYFAVRDKKAIKQGVIVSTAFSFIIGFGAYFVGGFGHLFADAGIVNESSVGTVMPEMIKYSVTTGLLGLIIVLIVSASMSTLGSVSLSSSSVVSVDLYKSFMKKDASDKQVKNMMRIMSFVFIAISAGIAILNTFYKIAAITSLMSLSWGTLSGCFMGPFVVGLINKNVTKKASYASIITTLCLTVVLIIVFGYMYNDWTCAFGKAVQDGISCSALIGVICMAVSVLVTLVVSIFTKKPSKETIYECFEKDCDNLVK